MDDGNANEKSQTKNEALANIRLTLERLAGSPFGKQMFTAVGDEIGRRLGTTPGSGGPMDATRAQTLTANLHQMMANLIAECKEEQRKLRTGGVFGFGGKDLSAQEVDTAVAGLTAITFHFLNQMMIHMRQARKMGSFVAQQFGELDGSDTGPIPTPQTMVSAGLGGRGVLGAFSLSAERQRDIVNRLRDIHEYVIKFAQDIEEDIAGPHAASPSAHEKALNKAIMLSNRLDAGCTNILRLLDPDVDPKTVGSGETGKHHALPGPEK